jgi:hypothetical protein
MPPRAARFARRIARAASAGALVAALLEILLRTPLGDALRIPIEAPIFVEDDAGRIALRPSADVRSRGAEWDVRVVTNRAGLRDLERPASASAVRILGLGDSFTFAWGVPMEAGYLARAEDQLDRETRREIQIVKAAVPGWGPVEEIEWLRAHWDDWLPHIVVVGFSAGNDFHVAGSDDGAAARPYEVIEGILVPRSERRLAPRGVERFLRRRSALFRAAAAMRPGISQTLAERLGRTQRWAVNDIFLRRPPGDAGAAGEAQRAVDATFAALDALHALARERGAAFAVVAIPSRAQVHAEDYARFKRWFAFTDEELDMGRPQRLVGAWAARRGVPLLDLEPAMTAAAARDTTRLYFRADSHWTQAGHELAGRLLARFLVDRGLVGVAAPTAAPSDGEPGP